MAGQGHMGHSFRVSLSDNDLAMFVRRWGNKVEEGATDLHDLDKRELQALEYALETLTKAVDERLTQMLGPKMEG